MNHAHKDKCYILFTRASTETKVSSASIRSSGHVYMLFIVEVLHYRGGTVCHYSVYGIRGKYYINDSATSAFGHSPSETRPGTRQSSTRPSAPLVIILVLLILL